MAEKKFNPIELEGDRARVMWEGATGTNTGQWFPLNNYNDNTVSVSGTFASNALTLLGANKDDFSDSFTLQDQLTGADLIFNATGTGKLIAQAPKYIGWSLTAGAADLDITLYLRTS